MFPSDLCEAFLVLLINSVICIEDSSRLPSSQSSAALSKYSTLRSLNLSILNSLCCSVATLLMFIIEFVKLVVNCSVSISPPKSKILSDCSFEVVFNQSLNSGELGEYSLRLFCIMLPLESTLSTVWS